MKVEKRMVPEYGVTLDGVWIPYSFLEELSEQDVFDSQFGKSLGCPSREIQDVLEKRGLLERETRGGVHRGQKLSEFLSEAVFPERDPKTNATDKYAAGEQLMTEAAAEIVAFGGFASSPAQIRARSNTLLARLAKIARIGGEPADEVLNIVAGGADEHAPG